MVQQALDDSTLAHPVEVDLRFTRADISGQSTLLGVVYVQRAAAATRTDAELEGHLADMLQQRILDEGFDVSPLVDVRVLRSTPSL